MQCPHCRCEIEVRPHVFALGEDKDGTWQVSSARCPTCERLIVSLCTKEGCTYPAWPVTGARARLSDDVPVELALEYHTASQINAYSPEAAAAVSRRLLQRVLADYAGIGGGGLADQVNRAELSPATPAYVKEALRTYSRLAQLDSTSDKSLHPEALAPVQSAEVEWLFDVLESLFDLYFVQPARMRRKQGALEDATAGTPELSQDSDQSPEEMPREDV